MTYDECDDFTKGYIKAALWLFDPEPGPGDWDGKERELIPSLAPEAIQIMADVCQQFQTDNKSVLDRAYCDGASSYTQERAGHDFWLTRNHHGAGFWDRGLGSIGDHLAEAARVYGSADLYRGDNGLIYVT